MAKIEREGMAGDKLSNFSPTTIRAILVNSPLSVHCNNSSLGDSSAEGAEKFLRFDLHSLGERRDEEVILAQGMDQKQW